MLNFLQQKNKKQIVSEYILRITIFLLIFIFVSSLIIISLFVPSFFFVKYKNNTVNVQLESIKQKNVDKNEDPIIFIKNINRFSTILSDKGASIKTYRDVINKIVSLKNKDIRILSIIITKEKDMGGKKISISGTSNARDGLTLFERDIKTDGYFNSVIFPVSNFIKSSDSEFSATLTI